MGYQNGGWISSIFEVCNIYIYISTIHHGSLPSDFSNGRLGAQVVDHHGPGDEALHREIRREALEDFLGNRWINPGIIKEYTINGFEWE